jgi:hypothetical protein
MEEVPEGEPTEGEPKCNWSTKLGMSGIIRKTMVLPNFCQIDPGPKPTLSSAIQMRLEKITTTGTRIGLRRFKFAGEREIRCNKLRSVLQTAQHNLGKHG